MKDIPKIRLALLLIISYIVIYSQEYGDGSPRLWRYVDNRPTDR